MTPMRSVKRQKGMPKRSLPSIDIRSLETQQELQACVDLQRKTWGRAFADVVPPSILKISRRLGGVAAGAFDGRGRMLGFVYGMTGVERGTVVHWSDMLAVLPAVQRMGIGRRLKEFQRAEVARVGARVIYWTYDPLVARNAHLNFNVFGVRVSEYVENMYGESRSPVHRGIGTDRLIVAWPVDDRELATRRAAIAAARDRARDPVAAVRRIEVPARIDALQKSDMRAARKWRRLTRAAFVEALSEGYSVNGFELDASGGRGSYILTK